MTLADTIAAARAAGDPGAIAKAVPYANFIGIDAYLDREAVICTLDGDGPIVGNPTLPAIHGGVICAFLEHAALMQLIWDLAPGPLPRTINVSVEYLRSGGLERTHARALVTRRGRRVANVRTEAWQSDPERPVAVAHGHFLLAG